MPPSRSWPNARFNSITFMRILLGFKVDEIAILDQFADEGIDLPKHQLRLTFQITADESVLVDSKFERGGAGIIGCTDAELLRAREHTKDAADAKLSLMPMDRFT